MRKAQGPLTAAALAVAALLASGAHAAPDKVKIAFITDMSGLYSDFDGPGGLDAIRMAVADFGGEVTHLAIMIYDATDEAMLITGQRQG